MRAITTGTLLVSHDTLGGGLRYVIKRIVIDQLVESSTREYNGRLCCFTVNLSLFKRYLDRYLISDSFLIMAFGLKNSNYEILEYLWIPFMAFSGMFLQLSYYQNSRKPTAISFKE